MMFLDGAETGKEKLGRRKAAKGEELPPVATHFFFVLARRPAGWITVGRLSLMSVNDSGGVTFTYLSQEEKTSSPLCFCGFR